MTRRSRPGARLLLLCGAVVWPAFGAPAAAQTTMSSAALAIACGPRAAYDLPDKPVTVSGSLTSAKGVYAPWHRLVVSAGSEDGLRPGQEFFVRRAVPPHDPPKKGEKLAYAIVTAGWIRIDDTQSKRSIATIVHECDGIAPGDYLEPFAVPAVPTPLPDGAPDFSEPAKVLFGTHRQLVAGGGSMVVIDRGTNHGIQPGQRFTIYRASDAGPNVIFARGRALAVQADTSTIQLEQMRDAVLAGDSVAPHR